ncbi:cytochrome c biogenesis protein ResB [Porphyromonas sp.]|uniref:cytochrome c biogenesis protein ResB n=1 Tax=Porphyromonas sp. TaxID=1924944 RepID=UPI0026DB166C|nr:cytochrome c biogenesis protein ResB [Porphyromonas sp.]MDO4695525.1 cytochrome c biogenesis protein ResB [Porphyromonas sp.]MDO4771675.1 cytochrome c biogenesis protein ResB [Porphyromonas sp.]
MWNNKWGYKEAFVIVSLPIIFGWIMQSVMGPVPRVAFAYPVNIIIVGVITLIGIGVAIMGARRGRRPFLAGASATISVLTAFMALCLIIGFTKQIPAGMASGLSGWLHKIGLSAMLESRAFLLLYAYLLLVLATATSYRLARFRWGMRDIAFALNHVGLYMFMLFGLLSSSDMKRYTMTVSSESEQPEWRAIDNLTHQMAELPIAIELKSFELEEYPPKLMLLDIPTGDLIPKGRPEHILIDTARLSQGRLTDWDIEILEHLPLSAPLVGANEIVFKEFRSTGGAASVRVRATRGTESYEGWVSSGSYLFPYRSLQLSDSVAVVMPEREPKQFTSNIIYYIQGGSTGEYDIRVNHPLRQGSWYIYQLGYDRERGRWSTTSELELVYDPWIIPVYIGIGLMLLGALCLFLGPTSHNKKKNAL